MTFWTLIRAEACRRPLSLILLAGIAMLSTTGIVLGFSLIGHMEHIVSTELGKGENLQQLRVLPAKPLTFAGIGINKPILAEDDISAIRHLPGVISSRVIHSAPFPATVYLNLPGNFRVKQGIPIYAIAAEDVPLAIRKQWSDARPDETVPLLFNPQLIHYYNISFATRDNIPRVSHDIFMGQSLDITIGSDPYEHFPNAFNRKTFPISTDTTIAPWAIALPKQVTDVWMAELYGANNIPHTAAPVQLVITLSPSCDRDAIIATIQDTLGLQIEDVHILQGTLFRLSAGGKAILTALSLILFSLLAIGGAGWVASLIGERRMMIGLYRQHGAQLRHLLCIFAGGFMLLLSIAGCLGALCALLIHGPITALILAQLPIESTPYAPPLHWIIYSTALCFCLALIATVPPLWKAHKTPLLELLKQ